MKARNAAACALAAGLLLFVLSLLWPHVLPSGMTWDDARAMELSAASDKLHETMHAHGYGHDDHGQMEQAADDAPPEVIAAADRYQALQADLKRAQFWRDAVAKYLRWSALGLCGVGVVAYFASRQS